LSQRLIRVEARGGAPILPLIGPSLRLADQRSQKRRVEEVCLCIKLLTTLTK